MAAEDSLAKNTMPFILDDRSRKKVRLREEDKADLGKMPKIIMHNNPSFRDVLMNLENDTLLSKDDLFSDEDMAFEHVDISRNYCVIRSSLCGTLKLPASATMDTKLCKRRKQSYCCGGLGQIPKDAAPFVPQISAEMIGISFRICYVCGSYGHVQEEWQNKKTSRSTSTNERGHADEQQQDASPYGPWMLVSWRKLRGYDGRNRMQAVDTKVTDVVLENKRKMHNTVSKTIATRKAYMSICKNTTTSTMMELPKGVPLQTKGDYKNTVEADKTQTILKDISGKHRQVDREAQQGVIDPFKHLVVSLSGRAVESNTTTRLVNPPAERDNLVERVRCVRVAKKERKPLDRLVYGGPNKAARRDLWEELSTFSSGVETPWMLIGDFNVFLVGHEKKLYSKDNGILPSYPIEGAFPTLRDEDYLRLIRPVESKEVLQAMPPTLAISQDEPYWELSAASQFTIASAYDYLRQLSSPTDVKPSGIWQGPQRVKTFLFQCLHGRLLTNRERLRRRLTTDSLCPQYKMEDETITHVLRDCMMATSLWWRNNAVFDATTIPTRNRLSLVRSMATATTIALVEFDGIQLGKCSAYRAELWGVLYGLRLAWDLGFKKVMVQVDNKMVV
ncbi:Uncharacterized protein TCM_032178 [Theobroma cacao]|uniref:Uncharacterized protein n=1 Tax=Theobroma cacao TaxID=3641 RepID=A0A061FA34_THECC|nr:Uncharacterized protein TCM_032178 [Theobroma cacao]